MRHIALLLFVVSSHGFLIRYPFGTESRRETSPNSWNKAQKSSLQSVSNEEGEGDENDAMKFLRKKGKVRPFTPLPANAIGVDEGCDGVGRPMSQQGVRDGQQQQQQQKTGLDWMPRVEEDDDEEEEGGMGEKQGTWDDALQAYVYPECDEDDS
mmetsp:Transcript_24144/g.50346  ORF Transcript_24144/g.50346 Transcript_24144/m.50346 type:complete len:154 (-) Transcript_24144:93-554(-)